MKVGFIGLGMMGLSVARNLAKAGYEMSVFDLDPKVAAELASERVNVVARAADVGCGADIVFLSLPGPAEIEGVCIGSDGLVGTLAPGAIVIDLSTNSLEMVKKLEKEMAGSGIAFLEAPVSGGPWGAADATLAIWVGGDRKAFERAEPALHSIGKRIAFMGDIGKGTITKLVHNTGANIRAGFLAEIMNLGVKAGVDPVELFSAIRQGSNGRQRTFDGIGGKLLDGTYDAPAFKLKLAHKDLKLAVDMGRSMGVPMSLAEVVLSNMDEAMVRGWGERDAGAFALIQQEAASVEIAPVDKAQLAAILASD